MNFVHLFAYIYPIYGAYFRHSNVSYVYIHNLHEWIYELDFCLFSGGKDGDVCSMSLCRKKERKHSDDAFSCDDGCSVYIFSDYLPIRIFMTFAMLSEMDNKETILYMLWWCLKINIYSMNGEQWANILKSSRYHYHSTRIESNTCSRTKHIYIFIYSPYRHLFNYHIQMDSVPKVHHQIRKQSYVCRKKVVSTISVFYIWIISLWNRWNAEYGLTVDISLAHHTLQSLQNVMNHFILRMCNHSRGKVIIFFRKCQHVRWEIIWMYNVIVLHSIQWRADQRSERVSVANNKNEGTTNHQSEMHVIFLLHHIRVSKFESHFTSLVNHH